MVKKNNLVFLNKELDEQLQSRVRVLVMKNLIKFRKKFITDYIEQNFSNFMGEDRLLTSDEVMKMLQMSRQTLGRRVKAGVLLPVNPEAKRHYRFMKNDVVNYIERKGGDGND